MNQYKLVVELENRMKQFAKGFELDHSFITLKKTVFADEAIRRYANTLTPNRRIYRGWLRNDKTQSYEMVYNLVVMECDLDALYADNQYIMERTPFTDTLDRAIWTGDIIEVAGAKFVVGFLTDGRLNLNGARVANLLGNIFENPELILEN